MLRNTHQPLWTLGEWGSHSGGSENESSTYLAPPHSRIIDLNCFAVSCSMALGRWDTAKISPIPGIVQAFRVSLDRLILALRGNPMTINLLECHDYGSQIIGRVRKEPILR